MRRIEGGLGEGGGGPDGGLLLPSGAARKLYRTVQTEPQGTF